MIVTWAAHARLDLLEIGDLYAHLSSRFLDRLFDSIDDVIKRIGEHPESGAEVEGKPLRKAALPPSKYLLFYRITPPTLEVARIIHGSRDWFAQL